MKQILAVALVILALAPSASFAENFTFDGKQLENNFSFDDVESHTIYGEQEVPDTCYRTEQDGYRNECHTEYERDCQNIIGHECHTEYHQECHQTTRQECTPITRHECTPITRRECHQVNHRECTPIVRHECHPVTHRECSPTTRQECHMENVCRDVQDQICKVDPQGHRTCTPITRHECHQEQKCRTVNDQVCRDVTHNECRDVRDEVCRDQTENVCRDVPDQVCRDIIDQVCRTVPDTVCQNVPENVCRDVPDQVCKDRPVQRCEQVPNYVEVPYACTKTIQVPIGTEIDFNVKILASVKFAPVPDGTRPLEEFDIFKLNGEASLRLTQPSGELLLTSKRTAKTEVVAPKEKEVKVSYEIGLTSVKDFLNPITAEVNNVRLTETVLSFTLGKPTSANALTLKLGLARLSSVGSGETPVFQGNLDPGVIHLQDGAQNRTEVSIDLTKLSLSEGIKKKKKYKISLDVGLSPDSLKNLMNPQSLPEKLELKKEVTQKAE